MRVSRQASSSGCWVLLLDGVKEDPGECYVFFGLKPSVIGYSSLRSSSILIADTGIRVPGPKIAATPALYRKS